MPPTTAATCQCDRCGGKCQGIVRRWNKCAKCENKRCTPPPRQHKQQQPQQRQSQKSATGPPRRQQEPSQLQTGSSKKKQKLSHPQVQPPAQAQSPAPAEQVLLLSVFPLVSCGVLRREMAVYLQWCGVERCCVIFSVVVCIEHWSGVEWCAVPYCGVECSVVECCGVGVWSGVWGGVH